MHGLPIGVQVVGRRLEEEKVFEGMKRSVTVLCKREFGPNGSRMVGDAAGGLGSGASCGLRTEAPSLGAMSDNSNNDHLPSEMKMNRSKRK